MLLTVTALPELFVRVAAIVGDVLPITCAANASGIFVKPNGPVALPVAERPTLNGLPVLSKATFSVPVNCFASLGVNVTVTMQFDPVPEGKGVGQLLLVVNTPQVPSPLCLRR